MRSSMGLILSFSLIQDPAYSQRVSSSGCPIVPDPFSRRFGGEALGCAFLDVRSPLLKCVVPFMSQHLEKFRISEGYSYGVHHAPQNEASYFMDRNLLRTIRYIVSHGW